MCVRKIYIDPVELAYQLDQAEKVWKTNALKQASKID